MKRIKHSKVTLSGLKRQHDKMENILTEKATMATYEPHKPWSSFIKANHSWSNSPLTEEQQKKIGVELENIFFNNRYTVAVTEENTPIGMVTHLNIKRNDKAAVHDWRDLQRIKNELCGPQREAVELYPAEARLVDTANSYHLYVMPEGYFLPFGYSDRLVMDGDDVYRPGKARQRPWPADSRPTDLVTEEEALAALKEQLDDPEHER